jgi:hypothetical protein
MKDKIIKQEWVKIITYESGKQLELSYPDHRTAPIMHPEDPPSIYNGGLSMNKHEEMMKKIPSTVFSKMYNKLYE